MRIDYLRRVEPRNLRKGGRPTVPGVCAAFYQGGFGLTSYPGDIFLRAFLAAETEKRVPAFVFERLFLKALERRYKLSSGWYVAGGDGESECHWFRLSKDNDELEEVDRTFALKLSAKGNKVWQGWFEKNGLWLRSLCETKGTPVHMDKFAARCLQGRSGRCVKAMKVGGVPDSAVSYITGFPGEEKLALIRSRVFINCFLEPVVGSAFDVDAIFSDGGRIYAAEFKRKYSARNHSFGIDKHIRSLANRLDGVADLVHVLLDDPQGRKDKSVDPTVRLVDALTPGAGHRWRGIHLSPEKIEGFAGRLHTAGADSGQRWGDREQISIPEREFTELPYSGAGGLDLARVLPG